MKNRKQKTRGGPGARDPTGSRKYVQGARGPKEAARGSSISDQVRAGRMALRVGFEQGFPGFRSVLVSAHIPTHEVSAARSRASLAGEFWLSRGFFLFSD